MELYKDPRTWPCIWDDGKAGKGTSSLSMADMARHSSMIRKRVRISGAAHILRCMANGEGLEKGKHIT